MVAFSSNFTAKCEMVFDLSWSPLTLKVSEFTAYSFGNKVNPQNKHTRTHASLSNYIFHTIIYLTEKIYQES